MPLGALGKSRVLTRTELSVECVGIVRPIVMRNSPVASSNGIGQETREFVKTIALVVNLPNLQEMTSEASKLVPLASEIDPTWATSEATL